MRGRKLTCPTGAVCPNFALKTKSHRADQGEQGKTTSILSLIQQLPQEYKVVLLKNEYGDVEGEPATAFSSKNTSSQLTPSFAVDSVLASQSNITGVSEILNGCLCCTSVGLISNALMEVKSTMKPDRIIIESSGSAFPATLALQIKELEPEGFKLDGVVTVVDCVNFEGYEDSSPSAKVSLPSQSNPEKS